MAGAFVVATLLLSERVDESIASPVKANENNELSSNSFSLWMKKRV